VVFLFYLLTFELLKKALLKSTTKAHLALLGTNVFFAINFTAIKYLINGGFAKPFAINIIRVAVTAVLLWILFIFKPVKSRVQKKDVGRLFLCALTGVAINQLLFVKGLSYTYSIHASLLMLTTPILITILAAWLLKEKLNNIKIAGLILGITGATILVTAKENTGNANEVLWGDLLIILNAIAYTIYFILVKPLMKTYDPVVIIRIIFTIGFFMMLPFCWQEFKEIPWQLFTSRVWISLGLVVFAGTFLAYLFNVYGIQVLGASLAGTYIYSQPFFAAAIAIFFLGEVITVTKIIAAACIFLGVYLSNKSVKPV
jgi:drug/metabolite transporter (DMT)-like permease